MISDEGVCLPRAISFTFQLLCEASFCLASLCAFVTASRADYSLRHFVIPLASSACLAFCVAGVEAQTAVSEIDEWSGSVHHRR